MARILFLILACLPLPLFAQSVQQEYDVRFGGIRVAALIFASNDNGSTYSLAGRAESTGMVAVFRAVRFDMEAAGMLVDGAPVSTFYREDVDTGRRASTVEMRWDSGIPIIETQAPQGPTETWDVDPADQSGTIDPLSALSLVVRDQPAEQLCNWQAEVFDGRRRSSILLGEPTRDGDAISCAGVYRRVAGFAPEEMAERIEFPFTAIYTPAANGFWQLTRIDLQSLYGRVRITRTES